MTDEQDILSEPNESENKSAQDAFNKEKDAAPFQTSEESSERESKLFSDQETGGSSMSLRNILGGDILTTDFLRRQIWLLILIVICSIIYISNRYSCQQEMIEIDRLKKILTDIKYDALPRSSELPE